MPEGGAVARRDLRGLAHALTDHDLFRAVRVELVRVAGAQHTVPIRVANGWPAEECRVLTHDAPRRTNRGTLLGRSYVDTS